MVLKYTRSIIRAVFVGAIALFSWIDMHAQEPDSIKTQYLNEVTVSASRSVRPLKNIPHSVYILSPKSLAEDLSISTDITDLLGKEVPGLAPGAQSRSNSGQSLRGRSALIMIDGVPQTTPLRNGEVDIRSIDPAVVERVEVIKGATAIYGNGATGGIINYITKLPEPKQGLYGQTNINLTGGLAYTANTVGGKVGQLLGGSWGKWSGVVSANFEQTGEYKDSKGRIVVPNYSFGETDFSNVFAKLGYQISPGQRILATYNFNKTQQHTNYAVVNGDYLTGTPTSGVLGAQPGAPTGTRGNHNAHLQYTHDQIWQNTSFVADAYYTSRHDVFYYSAGRFDGVDGQSEIYDSKKGVRGAFNSRVLYNDTFYTTFTYGLDALNDVTSQPLLDGRIWVPKMHMNNLAPFVETEWIIHNDIIINGGFRFENTHIGVDDYQTLRLTNANGKTVTPSIPVKGGDLSYNAALYNIGIRFNRFKAFSPFVSFSQGFSVADIGLALRASKVKDIRDINTTAVKVNNFEIGSISQLGNLRLELSAFYSTSKLGTEMTYDNATGVFVLNRTPEHIYGFEVLANYRFNSRLEANATFSYIEGKQDTASTGHYNAYMNGRRISAPKVTSYIAYAPLTGLSLRLQYLGVLSRNRFAQLSSGLYNPYEGPVRAYHVFSFNGSYAVNRNVSLTLGIDNLFNTDYFLARSQYYVLNTLYGKGRGSSFNLGVVIKY